MVHLYIYIYIYIYIRHRPVGSNIRGPSDKLKRLASELISRPTPIRELLSQGIFISKNPSDRLHKLNKILPDAIRADDIQARAKKEGRKDLSAAEMDLIARVNTVVNDLIQVGIY